MFSVRGKLFGDEYLVEWNDGVIVADEDSEIAKMSIEAAAEAYAGTSVGPSYMGVAANRNHLNDPLAMLAIMQEVFDEILETSGDVPTAEYEQDVNY